MGVWELTGVLVLLAGCILVALATNSKRTGSGLSGRSQHARSASLWPEVWLVIKSRNVFAVQMALRLHSPRPCSWLEGLTNADRLFVAPPVKGWILVTCIGLPLPANDVDACFRFVLDLSRKLSRVQFFSAGRASQRHAWIHAKNGRIVRAYAWDGRTLWQQGLPTRPEADLGLCCFDYAEPVPGDPGEQRRIVAANLRKIPALAARWGLDPVMVQEHFPLDEHGITGRPVRW